ncbi:UDP-N-acetylmuramate--L-alanine ligase [Owenweeksia hongkongensis]|uniref:UDP-N-acetylmuramate--L-alanine ligase n=1 Tax=Owenweeksia hongkongensis TaxID=253245 RepID=UPI003A917EF9
MLDKKNIYMIGIGGIGMSALARYFVSIGKNVAGYDRTQTPLCEALESEGIAIHYEDNLNRIDKTFKDPETTTVVYTPAIPDDMGELNYFRDNGFELIKRALALGQISAATTCLAVAGTHGKTTTSALLAHLFKQSGQNISAFLGGIASNYQSNFLAPSDSDILVAEADEYDRSFLQLKPAGAIITSVDSDHLDIYGNPEELKATFAKFRDCVTETAIVHKDTGLSGITYGIETDADYCGKNVRVENHNYVFDIQLPDGTIIEEIHSGLPGRHNVENAIGAAALALNFGLSAEDVKAGIASFKGVRRRFEYHIKRDELVYIDDYAHHPAEINALVSSVRELYPNKRISGIFQPHLFTRTRDFEEGFIEALSKLDELVLMDIYPAREKPIPGINSSALFSKINIDNKHHLSTPEILTHFANNKPEIILTIGAGDIDKLINPLKMKLSQ